MSSKGPTKAEIKRFQAIQDIGCLACLIEGRPQTPCEIHHLVDGGRRGHSFTIGLCPWHHRGVKPNQWTYNRLSRVLGPSLAITPGQFKKRYGDDDALLDIQNQVLARMAEITTVGSLSGGD